MPIKEKIIRTKKERDVQRNKRWFHFVEDLKRLYAGFTKVAFELGLEGYSVIYRLYINNSTLREQFNWMDFHERKCKML